jgi:NDP-sugar pyrophosphorylase family protein
MKAMVLAAGLGTRMRPLTRRLAKPVLPVLNRPLIHFTLERLRAAGVTDVVVNLHHLPATVRRAVGDGSAFGLRVSYSYERRILGTGGGPRRVRELFGDEPVLLVNGDMLFEFDLAGLVARHRESGAPATLALLPNPRPRAYTPVVVGSGGRIRSIGGRPSGPAWLFTGVHVLDPGLLDRLPAGVSDSVRDLYIPMIAAGERVLGARVSGAWYDLGRPRLYLAAQVEMLASGVQGAAPRRSMIHPGAGVARGARVSASVVGDGAQVEEGAVVERSVIWAGARVGRLARVMDSILDGAARAREGEILRRRIVMGRRRLEMR